MTHIDMSMTMRLRQCLRCAAPLLIKNKKIEGPFVIGRDADGAFVTPHQPLCPERLP